METPQPAPQRFSDSLDVANAITFAGLFIAGAIVTVGFVLLWFADVKLQQLFPGIH